MNLKVNNIVKLDPKYYDDNIVQIMAIPMPTFIFVRSLKTHKDFYLNKDKVIFRYDITFQEIKQKYPEEFI